jgi:hypothetical protein
MKGNDKCIFFYNEIEIIDHLCIHCQISNCLYHWLSSYNNFAFNCSTIQDLRKIDANIPYKDPKLCELIRGAFFMGNMEWHEYIDI